MPILACTRCNADVFTAEDAAARILCPDCAIWPEAAHAMLPGARPMMSGDDDDGSTDEDEEEDEKPKGKKDDDDDDDDDRPRKKKRSDSEAPAKAGMGMGMILGIVGVLLLCCVCLPVGGGLAFVFMGTGLQGAASRTQALNNAKQIGLSLHNYNDNMSFLPSPRSDRADLSWRVAVLPYIEQNNLFNAFDPMTGWDKGKNQSLINTRPMTYDSPLHPPADKTQTPWQYFTGPRTPFPDPLRKVRMPGDFPDGISNTFVFAEGAPPVPWSKPADIVVPAGSPLPLPQGSFIACFADASARPIDRARFNDEVLRGLIDPADGKMLPPGLD